MPQYKLTYFNSRGRAELARLIFAAAGQEYADVRLDREQWAAQKPNAPFGQLPLLEVDGTVLCQSNAFCRYIARQLGLAGKTALEEAQADMVIDCWEDFMKPLVAWGYEHDENRKVEMKKKFEEEQMPTALGHLEKMLVSNKGGDGFFVGQEATWADLSFFHNIFWPEFGGIKTDWEKYPKLAALRERVARLPKIAEWIEKRPKTDM